MYHWNQFVKESGNLKLRLYEILHPELYVCSSIKDFLDNKQDIKPTKKILRPKLMGISAITFKNRISLNLEQSDDESRVYSLSDLDSKVVLHDLRKYVYPEGSPSQRTLIETLEELDEKGSIKFYGGCVCLYFTSKDKLVFLYGYREGPESIEGTGKSLFDFFGNIGGLTPNHA
ncbi:MAG: hypothetical protein AABY22_15210 [Nanoarchaeota archaeon]